MLKKDTVKRIMDAFYAHDECVNRKYETFRFQKETKEDGNTYVAFIDLKIELDEASKFLLISSLISVIPRIPCSWLSATMAIRLRQ